MRTYLSILVVSCLILGCRSEDEKTGRVEIETMSPDAIAYPTTEIQIPDSLQNQFVDRFFVPWVTPSQQLLANINSFSGKELSYLQDYVEDDEWYGENKKPHAKWQREEVVSNIDIISFPNFLQKGIIVAHTDLRRIPTNRPGFAKYSKAGEGYPFDYFQETGLWANTPILLLHMSKDKQWCYAISPIYKGWVPMHDIALVEEDFTAQWSTGTYGMPLSDKVTLHSSVSNYAVTTKMGMLLPYEEASMDSEKVLVYYANADENQNAKILKAEVNRNALALNNFKFNKQHLKQLVFHLVGRPYGWGGQLENRDCSSMIRDLMGTFKIWLPRDSKDQINSGTKYDLPHTADEKIRFIKEKGVPFLTILRKKGHNMLYVGDAANGEPLILHAIWGLKTSYNNQQLGDFVGQYPIEGIHKDEHGKLIGRYIIGEAVITSVLAGGESDEIIQPIIDEIYAMTTILID